MAAVFTPNTTRYPSESTQRNGDSRKSRRELSQFPSFFLAAASMLHSPTSLGSFFTNSTQRKEKAAQKIPDEDRMVLQS